MDGPTQVLAAEFTQTRLHCPALRRAVIVRNGCLDARFAHAWRRQPCLHAFPRQDDVLLWSPAAAEDGATFWSNVVGVDAVRSSDRTLFRVLELGGMEVE